MDFLILFYHIFNIGKGNVLLYFLLWNLYFSKWQSNDYVNKDFVPTPTNGTQASLKSDGSKFYFFAGYDAGAKMSTFCKTDISKVS